MATLTMDQIGSYAYNAGVKDKNNLAIAIAVAMAESQGNTHAHNGVGRDDSYGLWQINMLGGMGPERRKRWGLTSNQQLFDPAVNARAMASISANGKHWRDWTTFTGFANSYQRYIADASKAAGRVLTSKGSTNNTFLPDIIETPVENAGNVASGVGDIAEGLRATTRWIGDRNNIMRIAKGLVGTGLLIGGLFILAQPALTGAVGLQVGKVLKTAKG